MKLTYTLLAIASIGATVQAWGNKPTERLVELGTECAATGNRACSLDRQNLVRLHSKISSHGCKAKNSVLTVRLLLMRFERSWRRTTCPLLGARLILLSRHLPERTMPGAFLLSESQRN